MRESNEKERALKRGESERHIGQMSFGFCFSPQRTIRAEVRDLQRKEESEKPGESQERYSITRTHTHTHTPLEVLVARGDELWLCRGLDLAPAVAPRASQLRGRRLGATVGAGRAHDECVCACVCVCEEREKREADCVSFAVSSLLKSLDARRH